MVCHVAQVFFCRVFFGSGVRKIHVKIHILSVHSWKRFHVVYLSIKLFAGNTWCHLVYYIYISVQWNFSILEKYI